MEIIEAILHRIKKDRNTSGKDAAQVDPRSKTLAVDEKLERTANDLISAYTKSTSGYGAFDSDETVYRFPELLRDYVIQDDDFVKFTQEATKLIAVKMRDVGFSTGGYALFLRYSNQGRDWLLIAMLKLKVRTGVDEETMDLNNTLSFDIEHLHEAARVDLEKWQNNTTPYLSFVKKRQGNQDISHYFREAIGCTEYTDAKRNTEQMRQAFNAFVQQNNWTPEEKQRGQQVIFEHCEAKRKENEDVNLKTLSALVDNQNPDDFLSFIREKDYEIDEVFQPHQKTYNGFKRIYRKFGTVSLGFDIQDLIDGKVDYNKSNKCLTITNLPDELINEIKKYKQEDDNDNATD
jgi:nucleoid-associated protein